ncbi:hypothetical protein E1B28_006938 [Marasmius oreades]|uniref:Uncharacterized protein n=1 Tax=Marasmius oreades TaxID=181124 RepID=A0A9P7S0W5_9AGAR|nr:uncharacterized protein E1B28_006938 [Marasmius oreades]KAG7093255.1 hypothetical protein E1B28_006938 [Marasmius oreades]
MQYLSIITALLPFLLFAVQAEDGCDPGWRAVEDPAGSGNFVCEMDVIQCLGGPDRGYVNAETNAHHCCGPTQELVIYNQQSRVGVCCGVDQNYAGIAPNGKCCPKGQVLATDGTCTNPTNGNCPSCPNQPVGVCRLQRACGDATTTNGLKYGSCYQMTFPNSDGNQLGREPGGAYISEGHIQNVIYKICQTAAACGTGPVKPTDAFVIQDTVGPEQDPNGATSWIGNAANGAAISMVTAAANAAQFHGTTSCSKCTCVVSLTGVGKGLGYIGADTQPQIAFFANPRVALDMEFAEMPCDGVFNFP